MLTQVSSICFKLTWFRRCKDYVNLTPISVCIRYYHRVKSVTIKAVEFHNPMNLAPRSVIILSNVITLVNTKFQNFLKNFSRGSGIRTHMSRRPRILSPMRLPLRHTPINYSTSKYSSLVQIILAIACSV